VGHPSSGYKEVEEILKQRGMASALPSRRDALLPQDITATLCKAHQATDIDNVETEEEIKPLKVAPVWHGMALDLMLGNLEQTLWGWSDPKSIYSLDYWCQLDDNLKFVLVYDASQQALMKAAENNNNLSSTIVEHHLNNWMAYNGALLAFFLRNRNRCLLVSTQQVKLNAEACLQQLQPLLSTPLLSVAETKSEEVSYVVTTDESSFTAPTSHSLLPIQKLSELANIAGLDAKETQDVLHANIVEHYLLDQLISDYPASQDLYAELQSAANLPLQLEYHEKLKPQQVWEILVQQRLRNAELASGLHKAYIGMSKTLELSVSEQTREGELLLSQLHQVQEELEKQCLQKAEIEKFKTQQSKQLQHQIALAKSKEEEVISLIKKVADIQKQLETTKASGRQSENEKNNLNVALVETKNLLAAAKAKQQSQFDEQAQKFEILQQENELLLTQMHKVQEELERYFLENQKLKQHQTPAYYGAAERIKQDLSYRLGATMISRSRSLTGWLGMPQALAAERRAWLKLNSKQPSKILPPVTIHRDAHEAERVKNHLSYRLGQVLISNGGSVVGWVKLPFAISREVRKFRQQRKDV